MREPPVCAVHNCEMEWHPTCYEHGEWKCPYCQKHVDSHKRWDRLNFGDIAEELRQGKDGEGSCW